VSVGEFTTSIPRRLQRSPDRSGDQTLAVGSELECVTEPATKFGLHVAQLRGWGLRGALEEVLGTGDDSGAFGFGNLGPDSLELLDGRELVVVAAQEELGLGTLREKTIGIVAARRGDGKAESDEPTDARVSAAGMEANMGAKGESGKEDGPLEGTVEPVERSTSVVALPGPVGVLAFTQPYSAEIEAQNGQAEGGKRLHRVVDDLVVHGPAARRVRVADERGVWCIVASGVQKSFEAPGGAAEVVDGTDVRGEGGHGFSLRGVWRLRLFCRYTWPLMRLI